MNRLGIVSIFCLLLSSSPVMAARAATVEVERTQVHQFSDKTSVVLIELHNGTRLVVSNVMTLGFYKVRLPGSGLVGWVSGKALVVQPVLPSAQSSDTTFIPPPDLPESPPLTAP